MYNILAREIVCVYLCVVVYVSEYGLCMAQRVFNIQMSERAKEGRQRRSNSVTGKVLKRTDFSTSTLCVCVLGLFLFLIYYSILYTIHWNHENRISTLYDCIIFVDLLCVRGRKKSIDVKLSHQIQRFGDDTENENSFSIAYAKWSKKKTQLELMTQSLDEFKWIDRSIVRVLFCFFPFNDVQDLI